MTIKELIHRFAKEIDVEPEVAKEYYRGIMESFMESLSMGNVIKINKACKLHPVVKPDTTRINTFNNSEYEFKGSIRVKCSTNYEFSSQLYDMGIGIEKQDK